MLWLCILLIDLIDLKNKQRRNVFGQNLSMYVYNSLSNHGTYLNYLLTRKVIKRTVHKTSIRTKTIKDCIVLQLNIHFCFRSAVLQKLNSAGREVANSCLQN